MSAVTLDHLNLPVNDREASLAFYTKTLGFAYAGERPPLAVVRVNPHGPGKALHLLDPSRHLIEIRYYE